MQTGGIRLLDHGDPAALLAWAGADDADLRALARLAPRLTALFILAAPQAPGAVVVGGLLAQPAGAPLSVTGAGFSRRAALAGCLGEAAEALAQAPCAGDIVARAPLAAPPAGHGLNPGELAAAAARGLDPSAPVPWVRAARLPDGAPCLLPAPLVLRGFAAAGGPPLSLGCAAGPTLAAARRAAVLELFERDAAARWRAGGAAAPVGARAAQAVFAALGGDAGRVWLARIDCGAGPPTVVARSALGEGVAAGLTAPQAALSALREMLAAEAAAAFSAARASARGAQALAPNSPAPNSPAPGAPAQARLAPPVGRAPGAAPPGAALARLGEAGHPVRAAPLLRAALGVAVIKAVCFGLASG